MIEKISGITIRTNQLDDFKYLVNVFTREHGLIPVLVRKAKKKSGATYLNPLAKVHFQAQIRENYDIVKSRSIELVGFAHNIYFDMVKSSIVMFLAEVIDKTLHRNYVNIGLFDYISGALDLLEERDEAQNFHICFLWMYMKFLGIKPELKNIEADDQDVLKCFGGEIRPLIDSLDGMVFEEFWDVKFTALERKAVLLAIIEFMSVHFPSLGKLKSLEVLQTVFADD